MRGSAWVPHLISHQAQTLIWPPESPPCCPDCDEWQIALIPAGPVADGRRQSGAPPPVLLTTCVISQHSLQLGVKSESPPPPPPSCFGSVMEGPHPQTRKWPLGVENYWTQLQVRGQWAPPPQGPEFDSRVRLGVCSSRHWATLRFWPRKSKEARQASRTLTWRVCAGEWALCKHGVWSLVTWCRLVCSCLLPC